jgi:hypothetical protein
MKPYRIIEDSETHVTYEYRTAYTWTLYAVLLVMVAGLVIPNETLTLVGSVAIAVYFAAKLSLGGAVNRRIQQVMKSNSVRITGNKASFSNPLRIRVPK